MTSLLWQVMLHYSLVSRQSTLLTFNLSHLWSWDSIPLWLCQSAFALPPQLLLHWAFHIPLLAKRNCVWVGKQEGLAFPGRAKQTCLVDGALGGNSPNWSDKNRDQKKISLSHLFKIVITLYKVHFQKIFYQLPFWHWASNRRIRHFA